jgi:hypothetical protein
VAGRERNIERNNGRERKRDIRMKKRQIYKLIEK